MEKQTIAVVGYSGYFGKFIFKKLLNDFSQTQFILLGRKKPKFLRKNVMFYFFDFTAQNIDVPFSKLNISLLVDLSGPVKKHDGFLLKIAMENKIPYMDMAVHNSHLNNIFPLWQSYKKTNGNSTVLSHCGFFPGISNLLIAKGFTLLRSNKGILLNTFPVYAGGGRNVARSLLDMLDESHSHRCITKGKMDFFKMHSVTKKFSLRGKNEKFYKWEYPEISCFLHSHKKIEHLERYFSLRPRFANSLFSLLIYFWNLPWLNTTENFLASFLKNSLEKIIYASSLFFKSFLFFRNDPSLQMQFVCPITSKPLICLKVKNAVSFHGFVTSAFVRTFLGKKNVHGFYTPEQLFSLAEILPEGKHHDYELKVYHR